MPERGRCGDRPYEDGGWGIAGSAQEEGWRGRRSYIDIIFMVGDAGLEPTASGSGDQRSIQLS